MRKRGLCHGPCRGPCREGRSGRNAGAHPSRGAVGGSGFRIGDSRIRRFHQICTNKERCLGRSEAQDADAATPNGSIHGPCARDTGNVTCGYILPPNLLAWLGRVWTDRRVGTRLGTRLRTDCHSVMPCVP